MNGWNKYSALIATLAMPALAGIMLLFGAIVFALAPLVLPAQEPAKPAASPTPSAPTKAAMPPNMESFILVLLVRPADAPTYDEAKLKEIQAGHLANIKRLANEGKIVLAGPFEDHSGRNVRGMFLMKTDSVEQAREWTATDPAVKAGRLKPEFLKWFTEKGRVKY